MGFCTSSWCSKGMRLWGFGEGVSVLFNGKDLNQRGQKVARGASLQRQSQWFSLPSTHSFVYFPFTRNRADKPGPKRHWSLNLTLPDYLLQSSQLPRWQNTRATLWRGPDDRDPMVPADNWHELASHVNELSQTHILWTQACLQIPAALADLATTSRQTPMPERPS